MHGTYLCSGSTAVAQALGLAYVMKAYLGMCGTNYVVRTYQTEPFPNVVAASKWPALEHAHADGPKTQIQSRIWSLQVVLQIPAFHKAVFIAACIQW